VLRGTRKRQHWPGDAGEPCCGCWLFDGAPFSLPDGRCKSPAASLEGSNMYDAHDNIEPGRQPLRAANASGPSGQQSIYIEIAAVHHMPSTGAWSMKSSSSCLHVVTSAFRFRR
jgi:hypothetical protein